MITHSPPTSEDNGSNPGTYVGKLVVADVPFTLQEVVPHLEVFLGGGTAPRSPHFVRD